MTKPSIKSKASDLTTFVSSLLNAKDFVFAGCGSSVSLRKCTCLHSQQDAWYGKTIRVFNQKAKDNGWRCTVCGTQHSSSGGKK